MNQNQRYEEEIGRPLFLPLRRTKQFRNLLLIVLSTFAFVAALFFGIGYIVGVCEPAPKALAPVPLAINQAVFVNHPSQGLLT